MMRILCLLEVDKLDVFWLIFTLLEILVICLIELPKEVQKFVIKNMVGACLIELPKEVQKFAIIPCFAFRCRIFVES